MTFQVVPISGAALGMCCGNSGRPKVGGLPMYTQLLASLAQAVGQACRDLFVIGQALTEQLW